MKSFEEYFDDSEDSTFDWMRFIRRFRKEVYENPEKLKEFFNTYTKFVENTIPEASLVIKKEISLEFIAIISVLADYDFNGKLSESFLESERTSEDLSSFYDKPKNYKTAMKVFSEFVGLEGKLLREYIFDKSSVH